MKFAMHIVMLLVAICALFADTHALPKHRPRLPSGPGYGPFNPRQSWPVPLPNVSILINMYVRYVEYSIFCLCSRKLEIFYLFLFTIMKDTDFYYLSFYYFRLIGEIY